MKILEATIRELYKIEPFWNICNPCQCKGHCCIGADISISESEWAQIERYIQTLPYEGLDTLRLNIKHERNCVFRAYDRCLIHPVRPENCRFTPYQYCITPDSRLRYTQVMRHEYGCECVYESVDCPIDRALANTLSHQKFAILDNFGRPTVYLSLNWQVAHCQSPESSHYASEWIRVKPLSYLWQLETPACGSKDTK